MLFYVNGSLFDFEQAVIALRYAAYDEPDPDVRAVMLGIAAVIETLWQVASGEE